MPYPGIELRPINVDTLRYYFEAEAHDRLERLGDALAKLRIYGIFQKLMTLDKGGLESSLNAIEAILEKTDRDHTKFQGTRDDREAQSRAHTKELYRRLTMQGTGHVRSDTKIGQIQS